MFLSGVSRYSYRILFLAYALRLLGLIRRRCADCLALPSTLAWSFKPQLVYLKGARTVSHLEHVINEGVCRDFLEGIAHCGNERRCCTSIMRGMRKMRGR
ncbi:hypothetical protein B0T21DRAFT_355667 [Apiosordaria backusii]|uniref:Uncharacterized protein n=1 Tax=Apiosordaria backusii TaxID=314023 RepID=A0AA40EZ59_9PEZI|nr:hypothetical protein B0T21DRAFT_355667 [Apiosordaria backusii]